MKIYDCVFLCINAHRYARKKRKYLVILNRRTPGKKNIGRLSKKAPAVPLGHIIVKCSEKIIKNSIFPLIF